MQATLARAAYLVGAFRPSFVSTVTPKVFGATVFGGAAHGVSGRRTPFSKDIWQVASSRGEKGPGTSDGRRHRLASHGTKGKRSWYKEYPGRRTKRSIQTSTARRPEEWFSGGGASHWGRRGRRHRRLPSKLVHHFFVPFMYTDESPPSSVQGGDSKETRFHLLGISSVPGALKPRGKTA